MTLAMLHRCAPEAESAWAQGGGQGDRAPPAPWREMERLADGQAAGGVNSLLRQLAHLALDDALHNGWQIGVQPGFHHWFQHVAHHVLDGKAGAERRNGDQLRVGQLDGFQFFDGRTCNGRCLAGKQGIDGFLRLGDGFCFLRVFRQAFRSAWQQVFPRVFRQLFLPAFRRPSPSPAPGRYCSAHR